MRIFSHSSDTVISDSELFVNSVIEAGKRLAAMGREVTVYCRNCFTPDVGKHNGMKLVRLPTVRSKHWETVIHTFLSTMHGITRRYEVVHDDALGPALFSFLPHRWHQDRCDGARARLAAEQVGTSRIGGAASGREGIGTFPQWNNGCLTSLGMVSAEKGCHLPSFIE